MAKRRKPAAKVGTRRTPRRGKQAAGEGESSAAEPVASDQPSEQPATEPTADPVATPVPIEDPPPTDPQTSEIPTINPNLVPTVVLHKKFGKYRCLFNNDDTFTRKYDLGSDSETNSSIEIRVVDPCASSESDSNAAPDIQDTQSDTNSGACSSPVDTLISATQSTSRDMSPITMLSEIPLPADIPLPSDYLEITDKIQLDLIPLPPPLDPEPVKESDELKPIEEVKPLEDDVPQAQNDMIDLTSIPEPEPLNKDVPIEEEPVEYVVEDDDEMITIVQIVEDDNPELYYNIKIDSPKNKAEEQSEETLGEIETKRQDSDFQKHFQELSIATSLESNMNMPMDCSELNNRTPPCGTPDLQFQKENLDVSRPDPSLTPSSTLSDDSNSSRVTEQNQTYSNDSAESSPSGVRRSSRIKTISNLKQKTKGYGLVKTPLKKALITQTKLKLEELGSDSQERSNDALLSAAPNSPSFPVPSDMPVKVKSRWRRSSELEMGANSPANSPLASPNLPQRLPPVNESQNQQEDETCSPISKENCDKIIEERMKQYEHLEENEYMCERMISKETKKMICDCFMTKEELERGELACGEDCLNRLLMIECNSRCPVGDRCTNRRFQKKQNAPLKVFYADKKGCGVEAVVDIPAGEFLMEYVGEVLDYDQFYKRAQEYSDDNNLHHYFMSLKGDTVIDATLKGNISRFINHSCEPNAETQKWTVNGELRIGFFSKRDITAGEELTFDYQFQRFGKEAQRCYCGADTCRGWIGAEPDSDDEEEEEEDVSTSKSAAATEERTKDASAEPPRERVRKPRERKYKPKAKDLVQDADIEEDLEALTRTGVKNQSHTLRLSRTVVRAKTRRAQTALLRLLRDADLPCRRLFLDYRGLRLLAPWCADAPLDFRLEMLQTIDRLPVPNKTLVQESRFFTIVERWFSAADTPPTTDNVFIDESTGLPVELPNRPAQEATPAEKSKEITAMMERVKDLSSQLLERWSSLKEVFKIPKKERIQQMKEHERQANVERRAADSSGSRDRDRDRRDDRDRDRERDRREDRDRERERERERERDRERDRERERDRYRERDRERDRDDRDRRKRRSSPEGRRSIRLNERVLAAVPPLSKEERRRAFAEAAAAADESRRRREQHYAYWPPESFAQMFPGGIMPPNMMVGGMSGMGGLLDVADFPPGFYPPFAAPHQLCVPHHNMPNMPNMPNMQAMGNMPGLGMSGYGGYMFGQQLPAPFPQHHVVPQQQAAAHTQQQQPAPTSESNTEVVLPSLWRSAKDDRGRTYYYHVKLRQPQWLPPPPPVFDDSSSEEEDEVNTVDDMPRMPAKGKFVEGVNGIYEVIKDETHNGLIPEHALITVKPRKRRPGLVSERPISPRTEEDKLAGRMEVKRYKQTKEKLRRRRERLLQKVRLLAQRRPDALQDPKIELEDTDSESESESPESPAVPTIAPPSPVAAPAQEPVQVQDADEAARKIKEHFRSAMARVMVQHLNPYRHSEAKAGRITCTADFKHLARKLTHFVMLKELKHCKSVEELVVTDSVRSKAKMFVKKYMAKFGPVYRRPPEEID